MYSRKLNLVTILVVLAGLFTTSEGLWTNGASGIFKGILGTSYVLMQEQSLVLLGILFILCRKGIRGTKEFLLVCVAFLSIGWYEYIVSCFFDTELFGFRQFLFGFLYPVMLMLFISRTNKQKLFFKYYYIGYIIFIGFALIIFLFFDDNFNIVRQGSLSNIVLSVRNHYADSLFFLIVGNANKQSNYLLMSLFLAPPLLQLERSSKLYSVFVVFAVILLFLLCSRATLMLLPIALYINRAYFTPVSRKLKVLFFVGFGLFLIVFWHELLSIVNYVAFSVRDDQHDDSDFLGTFHSRFIQWEHITALFTEPGFFIHGIGVGNYGLNIQQGSESLGTHNLFLDHLVASGLYGALILVLLIVFGVIKSIRMADRRLLIAYVFFVCLAFREYSFAYLYVTSMGGLIFSFMLYLTFSRPSPKVRANEVYLNE